MMSMRRQLVGLFVYVTQFTDLNSAVEINAKLKEYVEALEEVKIKNGLKAVMALSTVGNQYLQWQKPWDLIKDMSTSDRAGAVTSFAVNLVLCVIIIAEPYIPSLTDKVLSQLNLPRSILCLTIPEFSFLIPEGHEIGQVEPLFSMIDDATVSLCQPLQRFTFF
jgi:methionyl-tRNA synthetase